MLSIDKKDEAVARH